MTNINRLVKNLMWDISGAFGDIGVLFPIAIVLIAKNGFNPTALFLTTGLFYIISAYYFKITMPVQPLKAMSAIAIAAGLGAEVINAAGVEIGIIFLFIAVTGLSVKLGKIFPVSVIRGIQLGLGLMLIKSSFGLIGSDYSIAFVTSAILAMNIFVFKKIPPLLPILALGILFSFMNVKVASIGPLPMQLALPDIHNLWIAFTALVLPQIALSFGNAIVATENAGRMLYAERASKLNLRSIPLSMGIANIASGIVGGVPMCHGSGGLTAHSKFGATRETSGYIIGLVLIILAVFFGRSGLGIISGFPGGILGVLLCYVGIQHALFIRDIIKDKADIFIAVAVAAASLITNNLTIGFLIGIGIHYSAGFFRDVKIIRHEEVH